eukprot:m.365518 g.365518  ORF g.365518 m.365518 type:complete len:827 (+) comp31734_c0_seq1:191-2671(+)
MLQEVTHPRRRWRYGAMLVAGVVLGAMLGVGMLLAIGIHSEALLGADGVPTSGAIPLKGENKQQRLAARDTELAMASLNSGHDAACTVHIALVCVGQKAVNQLEGLVKSVLMHRSTSLQLHVITSDNTRQQLTDMFASWQIPHMAVILYNAERELGAVSWVPSSHYSGQYPLLKLILPRLLDTVPKVIVLDLDLLVLTDPLRIWKLFDKFTSGEILGVVENQSEWYVRAAQTRPRWPAPEPRGVNTGVMLMYLERMRELVDWQHTWVAVVKDVLADKTLGLASTQLADQDVINAVLVKRPEWVLYLSCVWNFQMSDHSQAADTCRVEDALVIHWNSKSRQQTKQRYGPHFAALDRYYRGGCGYDSIHVLLPEHCQLDATEPDQTRQAQLQQLLQQGDSGEQVPQVNFGRGAGHVVGVGWSLALSPKQQDRTVRLERSVGASVRDRNLGFGVGIGGVLLPSNTLMTLSELELHRNVATAPFCRWYRRALAQQYRVHPLLVPVSPVLYPSQPDISRTTEYAAAGDGGVHVEQPGLVTLVTQFSMDRLATFMQLVEAWPGLISASVFCTDGEAQQLAKMFVDQSIDHVALHVVYRPTVFSTEKGAARAYPINLLRNLAIDYVPSDWYFHLDSDFSAPPMLHATITRHLAAVERGKQSITDTDMNIALVVPAFETTSYKFKMPKDRDAVLRQVHAGNLAVFRAEEWGLGHRATDYSRWSTATVPYPVDWELGYEPYVVVPKTSPRFSLKFVGFGWNKVSHIAELAAASFRFIVIPDGFVVHKPHAPSPDLVQFRHDQDYRKCIGLVQDAFLYDLNEQYKTNIKRSKTSPQ